MDDWELIGEFVGKGSAGAFEALVGRYLGMVYGVAMREVGEHHLAEDVTQAVFALLAKKAPEMWERKAGTVVAGWLFQTARFAARNAKKMERRRRFHEEQAGRLRREDAGAERRDERMLLLDGALARLGERDRGAVLLRYYRRLEMAEVGKALGVSEGAARRRVERAVGKLRVRMSVAESGAAGMLGAVGVAAMKTPAGVASGALACAKGDAGYETIKVMMKGALKMMFWAKMKVAAMVAAAVMVVGGAGTLTVTKLSAHEEEKPAAEVTQTKDPVLAMHEQLDALDNVIHARWEGLDTFRKSNDITGVADLTPIYINQLARLDAKLEDAALQKMEATRILDAKKAAKDLPAGELDKAQDAYDKAVAAQMVLRQMRDDCEKRLKDMDHFLVEDQRFSADLKALEEARTKLYVKMVLAETKK